jgi:hypothetical protein
MRMRDPDTALIITENEEGEIIDVRVVDVSLAMFILKEGKRRQKTEEKAKESESLWWHPSK